MCCWLVNEYQMDRGYKGCRCPHKILGIAFFTSELSNVTLEGNM